ncbi:MAG: ABC transporter permease [Acidobacteriota bacterium]|jgi:ABC-2 type transport system permease protein
MNFLVMPPFFFSGALFPLDGLPKALRLATELNPLTYGVDGLRGALTHGSVFGLGTVAMPSENHRPEGHRLAPGRPAP